jgi:hypothetical protein
MTHFSFVIAGIASVWLAIAGACDMIGGIEHPPAAKVEAAP